MTMAAVCDCADVTRLVIGLTFLAAALLKWRARPRETQWAPFKTAWPRLVPHIVGLEWGLAVWLIAGIGSAPAFVSATALLSAFTVYVGVGLRRGESSGCQCFGDIDSDRLGGTQLARNLVLLSAAAAGTFIVFGVGCEAANSPAKVGLAALLFLTLGAVYLIGADVERFARNQRTAHSVVEANG
jgi:hypothetical protein